MPGKSVDWRSGEWLPVSRRPTRSKHPPVAALIDAAYLDAPVICDELAGYKDALIYGRQAVSAGCPQIGRAHV